MKRQIMTNNSEFYCLNCGKRGIPIMRKVGKQKADKHRKKMYCPYCRLTRLVEKTIYFMWYSGIWKINMG